MKINFTIDLPDEPFKDTFNKNKTVTITYNGPRFIVVSIFKNNNQVSTHEGFFDSIEEIDLSTFCDDDKNFIILDAKENPLEASFITNWYSNEDVADYEESLPNGEKWIYFYENQILGNIYSCIMPYYDFDKKQFSKLELLLPPSTREEYLEAVDDKIKQAQQALLETDTNDAHYKELEEFIIKVKEHKNLTKTVDFWKLSFPIMPS